MKTPTRTRSIALTPADQEALAVILWQMETEMKNLGGNGPQHVKTLAWLKQMRRKVEGRK